jgi:hypothetical protein
MLASFSATAYVGDIAMSQLQETSLGEIAIVAPASVWGNEVKFSEWLANNLTQLTDVLGVGDLELVGRELPVGDFRCDIVAREVGSGRTMIIENQFDKTDHDHLGKVLTYAAQHNAEMIVWISPEIREEHRAAIDWLNKVTGKEIGFFAVKLRVIKIDASRPAPLLEIQSSPNDWVKPVSTSNNSVPTPREESYRQFFQPLIDDLRNIHQFTNARVALPQSWYSFSSGTRGFNYTAEFSTGNLMRASVYIDIGVKEANKAAFDILFEKRAAIEYIAKTPLVWERLDNRRSCRIYVAKSDSSIDQIASNAPEAHKWLIERLLALKTAFAPELPNAASVAEANLKSAEPPEGSIDGG